MSKGDPVTCEELTPERKQKFDEIKALFEADLIRSFERTHHHGIRWKGFSSEGTLDGVDLSLPLEKRTRALRQEVNYTVAHSLHRHSESLVNAFERVTLRIIQEIVKNRYSPIGPTLGSHRGNCHFKPGHHYLMHSHLQNHTVHQHMSYTRWTLEITNFFNEPPKEVPHGYACAYIPDSSNPVHLIQQAAGGFSGMDADKQA
jgi:hypothetical protein